MKRLLLAAILLGAFVFAWNWFDVISIRVVGQPSITGPIQSELEKPFFESLQEKTGLPIRVEYRTVDTLGFKDTYQLAMMRDGMFDMVSLRFLQNGAEEPSIIGIDLPGLNPDYQTARKVSDAYFPIIDEQLQGKFGVKLLGIWTFGPQVIFCRKPISQLADLKGMRVRVGGTSLSPLFKSQGAIPVVIPFDQVSDALALKIVDCAVTSETSAYSANWLPYLTHVYPIATQMGLNGIAIRLKTWNQLSENQQLKLANVMRGYIDNAWNFSEKLANQSSDCIQGNQDCQLTQKYSLVVSPVTIADMRFMRDFALNSSFPAWAERCNQASPDCSTRWKKTILPVLDTEAGEQK